MSIEEQRKAALELFIEYDRGYADAIAELGYPSRHTLRQWWLEYEKTGKVPSGKCRRNPKYDESARRRAADYCIGHGKSLSRTMRALGYPKSSRECSQTPRRGPGWSSLSSTCGNRPSTC